MAARLYEISEELFCDDKRHRHGQQTRLATSPQDTWELKAISSMPEATALKYRPYYLFIRPYGLYHPGLCGVLPSLGSLLFPYKSLLKPKIQLRPLQTYLLVKDGKWALHRASQLRKDFLSLPREIGEMVFKLLVQDIDQSRATDSPVCDYDSFVVIVDVSGRPNYRSLERRCPGVTSYTAFLGDGILADEAERILLGSDEIFIDSRGLARFLRTRQARWVKRVLIVVGLWGGEKTSAGFAVRWLEAQELTGPLMALSSVCTQLQSVRVEVCLWSTGVFPASVAVQEKYADSRLASFDVPELRSKYKALAQPLLHLERIGLLEDFLVRYYDRYPTGEPITGIPRVDSAHYGENRRLCRSSDVATNPQYEAAFEYWSSNHHQDWYDCNRLHLRYGPGAVVDPPVRDAWQDMAEYRQEYDAWVPIYYYQSFTARHWVQFALREELDLQTAKDATDFLRRTAPSSLDYTYGRWVLHSAIRELLAAETEPFDYPTRQRGKHGNFVMEPGKPLELPGFHFAD